jgi:hypothetical protein
MDWPSEEDESSPRDIPADKEIAMTPIGGRDPVEPGEVPPDPGSTEGSVFTPPYKVGSGPQEVEQELPLEAPKNRREAFLMAKTMLTGGRGRLTPLRAEEILQVADWLLGLDQIEQQPPVYNPALNTASAYEPLRRERPSGLAFLYHHPPCHAVEWRNATEVLGSCMVEGCSMRMARWEVLFKEKNA